MTVVAAADGVTISTAEGATSVKRGRTLQFSAQVSKDGSADGVSQEVTWTLTGNTAADTAISDKGLLTVGLEETVGNVLTLSLIHIFIVLLLNRLIDFINKIFSLYNC